MKILQEDVKHDSITVIPEMLDDLWVLYNLILKNNKVYAKTTREIRVGDRYDRPEKGKRVSVSLGIKVEKVMWDRQLNRLRILGIICDAPENLPIRGSRHALNVSLNSILTIVKDKWQKYQIDQLHRAAKARRSNLILVSIDDEGYCIAILRQFEIDVRMEEKVSIPGKYKAEERTKAFQELFKSALNSIEEYWASTHNPIVILGLGYVKNDFVKYLKEKAPSLMRSVIDVKSVNSSGVSAIHEALRSGILTKALKYLRIAEETEVVEEVLKRLGKEKANVTYGFTDVERACTLGAIDRLLLTDIELREATEEERVVKENLMKKVEELGGQVIIISTEHEAGVKLQSLGGIAALLRFPINYS